MFQRRFKTFKGFRFQGVSRAFQGVSNGFRGAPEDLERFVAFQVRFNGVSAVSKEFQDIFVCFKGPRDSQARSREVVDRLMMFQGILGGFTGIQMRFKRLVSVLQFFDSDL